MGLPAAEIDENANFLVFPSEIYTRALKEIVEKKLGDFSQFKIECTAGSNKGDNYLGIVYRIRVKSKVDGSLKLSLVLKSAPQGSERRDQFHVHDIFKREFLFYDEIFPLYKKFQEEKGIDIETEGFHHTALSYGSIHEQPFEGIFLEDLTANGFEMFDRKKELTREHVLRTMEALAKMHAIFFAMKDQRSELIDKYKTMEDILIKISNDPDASIRIWIETQNKKAIEVIKKSNNDDLKSHVLKILNDDVIKQFYDSTNGKNAEPYAILCHGDCWNNNVMYKYKNGVASDIRLLDFQIMRYSSPVCDLAYYIFGCTTKELRDKHFKEFMDVYYDTLSQFIKRLGSCPEKLFPRHAFEDHWRRFGKFALLMGSLVIPALVADTDDVPDMDEISIKWKESRDDPSKEFDKSILTFTSENTVAAYEKRLMGLFQDLYDMKCI